MRALVIAVWLAGCATAPATRRAEPSLLAQIEASADLGGTVVGGSDGPTIAIVMASWCSHCRDELAVFDTLRAAHPRIRWLAVSYKPHEEYDGRGNAVALGELAARTPWLRVVPAGEPLFTALGRPPLIPTIYVFDRDGTLAARFDRRERKPPTAAELDALLGSLP